MSGIGFKASFNGSTRFINNPSSWDELVERIHTSHSIPAGQPVSVTYVDEDGDKITIDTQPEFAELVNYARRTAQTSGSKNVKIEVVSGPANAGQPQQSKDAFTFVVENARQEMEKMSVDDSAPISYPNLDAEKAAAQQAEEEQARKAAEEAKKAAEEEEARKKAEEEEQKKAEEARKKAEEEAAYQAFLASIQPQLDTVLSLVESAPAQYIPRLIADLGPSLAQRSWGLTIENFMGQTLGSTREGPREGHGHGRHGRRFQRWSDPEAEKRWWNVTCDGCGKKEWVGNRWRCQTCADYDLCDACHAQKDTHHPDISHEFVLIAAPDQWWNYVACDGCNRAGIVERFKCETCSNYDLCAQCHPRASTIHNAEHAFIAMGTPASYYGPKIEQVGQILDFASSPPEKKVWQEKIAKGLLQRFNGDVGRVVDEMLKKREKWNQWKNRCGAGAGASGSSSSTTPDQQSSSDEEYAPWNWHGRRGRHHHAHGRGGHHPYFPPGPPHGFPHPPPPPPPNPTGLPPPPPPMGPWGWWAPGNGQGPWGGRGWF